MYRQIRMITSIVVVSIFWSGISIAEESEKAGLSYTFNAGDKFEYVLEQSVDDVSKGKTSPKKTSFTVLVEVTAVDGASATCRMTFERIVYQSPLLKISFDSARNKETDDSVCEVFLCMVGKNITFMITAKGELLSVSGMSGFIEKAKVNIKNKNPILFAAAGKTLDSMLSNLNDDCFKSSLQLWFPRLPEDPVSKNDSWDHEAMTYIFGMVNYRLRLKSTISSVKNGANAAFKTGGEARRNEVSKVPIISSVVAGTTDLDLKNSTLKGSSLSVQFVSESADKTRSTQKFTYKATLKKHTPARK